MNGRRHLATLYSLVAAFGIFFTITVFEVGSFVNAQDSLKRDAEKRDRQIGVMDKRQRKIENQAAVTNSKLEAIKDMQKTILQELKRRGR